MKINELIAQIPENTTDEALMAVQSVVINPHSNTAKLIVFPANEFRILVNINRDRITLAAEKWPSISCTPDDFLLQLKIMIYEIDEAVSAGRYSQSPPADPFVFDQPRPPAPANMDIPVWDEKTGRWYDAEY